MLLRLLLFTAFDCLPLWITGGRGKLLLRVVHEITGVKLIVERIGHSLVHGAGKKDGKKIYGRIAVLIFLSVTHASEF